MLPILITICISLYPVMLSTGQWPFDAGQFIAWLCGAFALCMYCDG